MEKRRRINAVDSGIELPEALIHRIQSYLIGKQAAQTSVLSKSWYDAWLTRPDLDFDQRQFLGDEIEFSRFGKKTMKRYEDLGLKIESFKLNMKRSYIGDMVLLADELTIRAVKMGVNNLNLRFDFMISYVLPREVFKAESLVRLSLLGCEIAPPLDRKVLCRRLRYLSLDRSRIGDDTLADIILSCPLLEDLRVNNCKTTESGRDLTFKSPLTGPRKVDAGGTTVGSPIKVTEFCKLKYLLLRGVVLDSSFFQDFSIKLPLLEDLYLNFCTYDKGVQISSNSLKFVTLEISTKLDAEFSVPKIRKFEMTCWGCKIPLVSFISASKEWESNIAVYYLCHHLSASWLLELNQLLKKLSSSRISLRMLDLMGNCTKVLFHDVGGTESLPRPVVENLMLPSSLTTPVEGSVLDGLFMYLYPKLITVIWFTSLLILEKPNNNLPENFRALIQQVCTSFCIPEQNLSYALEEVVEVEYTDETGSERWCIPWKTWLDTPPSSVYRYVSHLKVTLRAA